MLVTVVFIPTGLASLKVKGAAALATILAARELIKDNCNSNGEFGIEQTTATLKMQVLQADMLIGLFVGGGKLGW
ncbi:hypothetical protein L1987_36961 [Smallanthus sonchifolius]|uniref:Uncharacterized protein n=1 Tax=Smallanthus sonchifolius TaxID=185202 RepID=A0ACB9HF08_9ASTR|nr:hypothetical protein L1987_36961 [Smallanthus sonchifolius]